MFGLLYQSLERMLIRRFGQETWEEIKEMINLNEKDITTEYTFGIHTMYDDKYALDLVNAASEVLGIKKDVILELFGEQFIQFCHEAGYGKILTCLAPNLKDFLATLDTLHEHLTDTYPGMKPPSFTCSENESGLIVTYDSARMGLESVVVGIIKSIARGIFQQEVVLEVHQKLKPNDPARFIVKEVSRKPVPKQKTILYPPMLIDRTENLVPPSIFAAIFPFHFVFTSDLSIKQTGQALTRIFSQVLQQDISDYKANQLFSIIKPNVAFSFQEICLHTHTVFVLEVQTAIKMRDFHHTSNKFSFRLKGQMIVLPKTMSLLFLGSPRVTSLEEIQARGLYLSDFPIHDATRDLLMMMECCRAEMAMAIKMELLTENLKETKKKLEEEKMRSESLLNQMLPIQVANQLKEGKSVTAERFAKVTILFSDIKNFVKMVGNAEPMQVVKMLNELYVKFDQASACHKVYKVETIGDAYMVVGGLPKPIKNHAEEVAKLAIDMMRSSDTVKAIMSESEVKDKMDKAVEIRIGMHTGPVVAGVVGKKMPRYCLFGQTVNIASRCESNGLATRIHITEEVYNELESNSLFVMEKRGPVEFKGLDYNKTCYWLEQGTYQPFVYETSATTTIDMKDDDNPFPKSSIDNSFISLEPPLPKPGPNLTIPSLVLDNLSIPLSPSSQSNTQSYRSKESGDSSIIPPFSPVHSSNSLLDLSDNRSNSPLYPPNHRRRNTVVYSRSTSDLRRVNAQMSMYEPKRSYRPVHVENGYINRGSGIFQPILIRDSHASQL
ncbi:retinal guanylyl cyclase 2 [Oopsacas minuta]|uniref:guanylate cyclase n=1 Tax=Oopsacas minuta TaxID=111878 RepID=A0AAV7KI54_9METZ|nr:retinal guanylyl cyclase 2 [Oopsacas minuta]